MATEGDEARSSLVPNLAVELAALPGNAHHVIEGSMLSADISGFTALSERLADKGKAGAEEITSLISRCFTALIDAAYVYGGEVLKFGGDALLVLFRGDHHELRVAAAAVAMQDALTESSAAKQARLTMTVGASEGPFDVFLVGTGSRDLLISGDRASKVIELEGEADKASTLISTAIAAALPAGTPQTEHPLGVVIDTVVEAPTPGPGVTAHDPSTIESLIAPSIRAQFAAFAELGGEHRIVAVDFLKLDGVQAHLDAYGGQATADALGDLFDAVDGIGERFDVAILHTDIAPDGVKFLLCAGAPRSTGQASDAILEAALQIREIDTPFILKQGIQSGRCFSGFLGSEYRRAYTLMGDIVNTAARMLGPAHAGDIVAVDDVFLTTRTVFITDPLPPVQAKGKAEPISASRLVAASDESRLRRTEAPLIGRDSQVDAFRDLLDMGGRVIQLRGPAGAGKSRLLDAFRAEASSKNREVVTGNCSPYSHSTPYAVLRVLLRALYGIDTFADPETAGDLLLKAIRHNAPELEPMTPIAAIPLGASVARTPQADAIDEKYLRPNINRVVEALLSASLDDDVVLVVEDVHWLDDPSAEFFEFFANNGLRASQRTIILTTRPENAWQPDLTDAEVAHIEVAPLTDDDIRSLALATTKRDLTDLQLNAVARQAAGNPLFAIELAKAIGDSTDEAVPDTVEQLIGARIDALDPGIRHAMRVASVFGYRLRTDDLRVVLSPHPPPNLDAMSEFLVLDAQNNLGFIHALYREVAYEGLPFKERRRLHRRVGEHLETVTPIPSSIADVLALHFSEARDSARTWMYGVMAGDAARQKTASAEAIVSYKRALEASARLRHLNRAEVTRVAIALGDSATLVGDFDDAERAFRRARSNAQEREDQFTAMVRIGRLREGQGRLGDALRWYTRVEDELRTESWTDVSMLRVRSEMHHQRSGIYHRRGEHQGCIVEARQALGTAEDANDVERMAQALHRLHLATIYLGRPDRIGYGLKALEMFTELGDYERQASVLNNLGIEHYFNGRWTQASESYQRATEAGLRAGSAVDSMLGAVNSGEILSDQGLWTEAIAVLDSARRNWEDGRYPTGLAVAKLFLGVAHSRRGDDDEAQQLLTEAIDLLEQLGLDDLHTDARSHRFWHEVQAGTAKRDELEAFLAENDPSSVPGSRALRALGCLAAITGDWENTRPRLLDHLSSLSGYSRALTLRVLVHYDGNEADPDWVNEAQEILDSLGVVKLRPLPEPPS